MKNEAYTGTDNLEVMEEAINYNRFLLQLAETPARSEFKILDFGAGKGTFAKPMRALGFDILCLEPDYSLQAHLSELAFTCITNLSEVNVNFFDYVYSFNVLEHIENDTAAIEEIYRVLRQGGYLLIYVPAFTILFSAMDQKVGHLRRYRKSDLTRLLVNTGFLVDRAEYVDSLGFLATLCYKLKNDTTGSINSTALKIFDKYVFPISRVLDIVFKYFLGKNLLVVAHKGP